MRSLVVFFTLAKLAAGQLGLTDNEVQPLNMPQITRLDVDCAKTGMTVNIEFSAPFNGVIFSKGFYANPSCRYVQSNSNSNNYNFVISMTDCGTSTYDEAGTLGFENTIVIQMEEIVQEIWDTARRISCDWKSTFEKEVVFNPIQVGMLNVEEVRFSGDNVECWMDIKRGAGPFGSTVDGILEIGEELTVVVYASDGGSNFDILVKNCYAYDSTDYDNPTTTKLPLIDSKGCLLKEKLMGYFRRTYDTRETGASIIAYARLNAFKFPDKMGVYLTCDAELCKGGCTDFCDDPGYPSEPEGTLLLPEVSTTLRPVIPVTTTAFICRPGSLDPRCPPDCFPGSTDPRCPTTTTPRITTTQFVCRPGSLDPRCPPECFPGSIDPRCPQPTTPPTVVTTTQFVCRPGSLDPRCPPECFPGSTDPRCPQTTTTQRITTTQFVCRPGSLDPRCPPECYQGSPDPRCPQTTLPPPPPPTTTQFVCRPGSLDPRCQPECFPGSTDPRCPTTPRPPPIVTQFVCSPGSTDPRCAPNCFPGSTDPRCPQTTQFSCQPGSLDPRCVRPTPPPPPVTRPPPPPQQTHPPAPSGGHYGNKDPMYHSFHRWMYEASPSRFTRKAGSQHVVRRKRQIVENISSNATVHFAHGFAVLSATDLAGVEGDSVHLFQHLRPSNQVCLPPVSLALGMVFCVTAVLIAVSLAAIQYSRNRALMREKL